MLNREIRHFQDIVKRLSGEFLCKCLSGTLSLENGYLYAAGGFYAESVSGRLANEIRFMARFKINEYNRFPYQLQEIHIDAN